MSGDRRILFFGDSFVAGAGDPAGLGWVGRAVAAAHAAGLPLTAYNLGVRGDTTLDVAARWQVEAAARTRAPDAAYGVVLGLGSNDMAEEEDRLRVAPGQAVDALGRLIDLAEASGLGAFVVGPPPVGDRDQDERIRELSSRFAHVATRRRVAFVETATALGASAVWTAEAAAHDGSHPGAGGYAQLAELVLAGGWLDWLAGITGAAST